MTVTTTLTDRAADFLGRRSSRRGFLSRTAIVGSALTVAGPTYVLRPGTAYAAVCSCNGKSCSCSDLCCDGYTEFCCHLYGDNSCPPDTLLAGWWKVDNSDFCDGAARYYMDCNKKSPACSCGQSGVCRGSDTTCQCRECGNRKDGCTAFRYGNCNNDVSCVGPIMCRVVTCTKPWEIDPGCTTVPRTDNNTRYHHRPCLEPEPSPAIISYVEALYADFLGRPSDPSGRDYWARLVANGAARDVVCKSFAFSTEYATTVANTLYRLVFDRSPDTSGGAYWRDQLLGGLAPSRMASLLFASDEFYTRVGQDNGGFVDGLFTRVLGRRPDSDGRAHWVGQLDAGVDRGEIATEIYSSLESRIRRVRRLYQVFLGRAPDPSGLDYWVEVIRTREDIAVALYLGASDEYFGRAGRRFPSPS